MLCFQMSTTLPWCQDIKLFVTVDKGCHIARRVACSYSNALSADSGCYATSRHKAILYVESYFVSKGLNFQKVLSSGNTGLHSSYRCFVYSKDLFFSNLIAVQSIRVFYGLLTIINSCRCSKS